MPTASFQFSVLMKNQSKLSCSACGGQTLEVYTTCTYQQITLKVNRSGQCVQGRCFHGYQSKTELSSVLGLCMNAFIFNTRQRVSGAVTCMVFVQVETVHDFAQSQQHCATTTYITMKLNTHQQAAHRIVLLDKTSRTLFNIEYSISFPPTTINTDLYTIYLSFCQT